MSYKILLIEDDLALAASLQSFLREEGFEVTHLASYAEVVTRDIAPFALVLLDWQLPDGRGIDLLKTWRQDGHNQPVIMLTAKAHLADKVLGLELGADDYVTKPFEPLELVTRIRVRLRHLSDKGKQVAPTVLEIAGISLDTQSRLVKFRGKEVTLTKLEFDLLHHFTRHPGMVFSREELLNSIWGYENYPTTRTIDTHVLQLRQKFGNELFETVRGIGYRMHV